MYPNSDTYLRALILEREIALIRAAREDRLGASFSREQTNVTSRRRPMLRALADRLALMFRSPCATDPLACT
jgi:hypothetical protein